MELSDINPLDDIFHALSDPTRRAILARLRTGNQNISDLAKPFEMSLPAVSKHISILEKAGLIVRQKSKQMRICALNHAAFKEVDQYLATYRRVLNQRLDRLEAALNREDESNSSGK